ncbi:glutamyl-tRNA reductase [Marinospirillum alkaliphilum]|uniref:Glutamyl-tRNA reductase n=1 Tax=Marinospirillum alkaliphilum DSM 21637 TaxID=1122209 RepID=A0A1K1YX60_9GAMM|nr:glutamyl-tRNA reductase [Marinospirillum alkaliphilum]SFX66594.1 glutamyl-tRNA reductase [Marinospirillum alkaliphilum DSM 21637]
MRFLALGINHKTAPVAMRERVAFTPAQLEAASLQLRNHESIKEAAILSTCNRTEIYTLVEAGDARPLLSWLSEFHRLPLEDVARYSYIHEDQAAIAHIMRVASGLDSMILGEPQILGQIKDAYDAAKKENLLGSGLEQLFQQVFATAKRVRTETAIGANPVSVAYAAVSLAQRIFADLKTSQALLIGAGETIELVARHLKNAGVQKMVIANRTVERAQALADEMQGTAVALNEIPHQLEKADIVISSTAAPLPILGKGMVERALKVRRHKPIFMVDIAVPRDIEPQVGDLDDIFLFTVDDLQEVIEENMAARREAAEQAEALITTSVQEFLRNLRVRDAGRMIRDFRHHAQQLADAEMLLAMSQLDQGQDPREVMQKLCRSLTNKWLHHPTLKIRQASAENRTDLLDAAVQLLNLDGGGESHPEKQNSDPS